MSASVTALQAVELVLLVVTVTLLCPAYASRDFPTEDEPRPRGLTSLLQKIEHWRRAPRPPGTHHVADGHKLKSLLSTHVSHGTRVLRDGHKLKSLLGASRQRLQQAKDVGQAADGQQHSNSVRFLLGARARSNSSAPPSLCDGCQPLDVPALFNPISDKYWEHADKILDRAGYSTPIPKAYFLNAPPATPTPLPWQKVMDNPAQPLDTKIGGLVMESLVGRPTETPPPTEAQTRAEFIEECPLVLFENKIFMEAATCGRPLGDWLDTTHGWEDVHDHKPRVVLRWGPGDFGGLRFGVDSAVTGNGSVLFADMPEAFALFKYQWSISNCMGVERWTVQEEVTKIDSMGNVESTDELSDIMKDSTRYFFRYILRDAHGAVAAESNFYKRDSNNVNFTEVKNGKSTGKVLAIATRIGYWERRGWVECVISTLPRGWQIVFPDEADSESIATVQDIRVALAASMNLIAYRDETRGPDGLNNVGNSIQRYLILSGVSMICVFLFLVCNCCLLYHASGLRQKLEKVLSNFEGAFLPRRPGNKKSAGLSMNLVW